ncbi:MAG: hypothetical protein M3247_09190 [Thermoproteota archaeon]|nr:hypothetical protein [Thermoproteota archaeon]
MIWCLRIVDVIELSAYDIYGNPLRCTFDIREVSREIMLKKEEIPSR